MPMYDFRCPFGHVFESLEPIGTYQVYCHHCPQTDIGRLKGIRVLLKAPSWRVGNANRLNMVVHQNEAGDYSFPGNPNAPTAEGYERVEITDVSHARRIEKEVTHRDDLKAQEHQYQTTQHYDALRKKEQGDLRAMMGDFSPKGKAFAEAALKDQSDRSQERSAKPKKTGECYFEALSYDKSNREPHRDSSTDWKGVE